MNKKEDFTLDETKYPREFFKRILDKSNKKGLEWVPLVDPGI
jgi:hypothetical protein